MGNLRDLIGHPTRESGQSWAQYHEFARSRQGANAELRAETWAGMSPTLGGCLQRGRRRSSEVVRLVDETKRIR